MAATRRLAAIMFTDMVGITAAAQMDEASALKLLREQEKLVRPLLKTHKGREIKSTGDGFLVEFDSACAPSNVRSTSNNISKSATRRQASRPSDGESGFTSGTSKNGPATFSETR